ncbi:flagellar hook-basal body complex protein FliE [Cryobacterium arcticum]|uniref:Flagellar hook-basal body complex protein FliE n=1 Tax=Cryobacterium arcticum TaxID=670052 RepID=A0A317ZRJ8_9MICO|nr:flagellar hook-basal body complex protein FliE [Cryobacterium arcticum]PXA67385.1 flagellar hook-basal body complex protein FliE [Cryobacterium arcticum]
MTIPAIGATPAVTATSYLPASTATTAVDSTDTGFATALSGAVDNLQQLQSTSDTYAIQAVTGDLDDIHTATLAASRAQVTLELVAAVRNKGVEAFNDMMRMQA